VSHDGTLAVGSDDGKEGLLDDLPAEASALQRLRALEEEPVSIWSPDGAWRFSPIAAVIWRSTRNASTGPDVPSVSPKP
jgi:hypothetical protein